MSNTEITPQDEYAYGSDEVDECICPATAAGFDTRHPPLSKLAGRFDEQLRDGYIGFDDGTVPDNKAESAWRTAVEQAREEGRQDEVEIGETIIERLWPE